MKYHLNKDVLPKKVMAINVLNEELTIKNYVVYMVKKLEKIVTNMEP